MVETERFKYKNRFKIITKNISLIKKEVENSITFQITDEDKEVVKNIAKAKGLSTASYCRAVVFEKLKEESQ